MFSCLYTCLAFFFEETTVGWLSDNSIVCSGAVCIFLLSFKDTPLWSQVSICYCYSPFLSPLLYITTLGLFQVYLLLWGPSIRGHQDEQQPSLPPPSSHPVTPQLPGWRRCVCLVFFAKSPKHRHLPVSNACVIMGTSSLLPYSIIPYSSVFWF